MLALIQKVHILICMTHRSLMNQVIVFDQDAGRTWLSRTQAGFQFLPLGELLRDNT